MRASRSWISFSAKTCPLLATKRTTCREMPRCGTSSSSAGSHCSSGWSQGSASRPVASAAGGRKRNRMARSRDGVGATIRSAVTLPRPAAARCAFSPPRSARPASPRQLASRPARLTARSRRSASRARAPGRHQQHLVAAHQPAGVVGHEGAAVPDDQHDGGVLGQPELGQVDAVQPGPGGHGHLHEVGVELVQRRGLDDDVPRGQRGGDAEPAGHPGQRPALHQGEDDDEHEDGVEDDRRAGHVRGERERGQHDRDGAAQAGPGDERLLAPRHAEPHQAGQHRQRPRHQQQRAADEHGRPDRVDQPVRRGEQPEQHEQPDLGQGGHPLGEPDARGPVRQRRVARAPGRTGRPPRSRTCAPATPRRTRARTARAWPADRSPTAAAPGGAAAAPRRRRWPRPTTAPPISSADDLQPGDPPGLRDPAGERVGEHGDEQDHRGVVETALGLEGGGHAPGQRQPAQGGEDGGRVGRADDRAQQQREAPADSPAARR